MSLLLLDHSHPSLLLILLLPRSLPSLSGTPITQQTYFAPSHIFKCYFLYFFFHHFSLYALVWIIPTDLSPSLLLIYVQFAVKPFYWVLNFSSRIFIFYRFLFFRLSSYNIAITESLLSMHIFLMLWDNGFMSRKNNSEISHKFFTQFPFNILHDNRTPIRTKELA